MKESMTEYLEAIKKLVTDASLIEKPTFEFNKKTYWLHNHEEVQPEKHQSNLVVNGMQALVDYIEYGCEGIKNEELFIHIVSPEKIQLYQKVTDEKIRPNLMSVVIDPMFKSFPFGVYRDSEAFTIGLQSLFEESPDLPKALVKASTISAANNVKKADKGGATNISSSNEINSGDDEIVFNLRPYRTFREIQQPMSTFIFRIENSDLSCALIEADGSAWRNKAVLKIKRWLSEKIKDVTIIG